MTKARDLANSGTAFATVSATELGHLDGVTSAVQTQIDSKIGSAAAINPTIVDAKGDIIAATAADTVSRLAIGANATVLTADSAEATGLKWAAPTSGGLTLISTTALSGATTTITATLTSFKNVFMLLKMVSASVATEIKMRMNADTGANYNTNVVFSRGTTAAGRSSNNATSHLITPIGTSTTVRAAVNGSINLYNVNSTAEIVMDYQTRSDDGTDFRTDRGVGAYDCAAAVSSVTFFLDSGTFSGGNVLLFGVN